MDPLSIASGIIAVLTASGKTLEGLDRVWELRHRSQEFVGLWNQTNGVRTLLWGIEIALHHIKESERETAGIQDCLANVDDLVSRTIAVFACLDKLIQDVRTRHDGVAKKKPSKRSWLRRKSKLVQLTSQVSALTVSLDAALGILQRVQSSVTANQTALKIDMVLSKVEALVARSPDTSLPPLADVLMNNISEEAQMTDQNGSNNSARSQVTRSALSRKSSWQSFHSALSTSSDSSGTLVSFSGSLSADTKCESFCPCQCHVSTQSAMPWWVTQLLGRITLHGNGSMLLNRQTCNKKHCRRSGSARLQISYIAPAWTLLQTFNVYVRAELIGGVFSCVNMSMPRVIPNSAVVWSIIELGRINELRNMLSRRETSPNDVSLRGESLLKYAAIKGQNEICACLIAENADPMFRDHAGVTAMQPGIDRVLSGSELDRNVSGTALRSFDLFINSESLDQQGFTLLHLIVLELQFLDLAMVLKHYPIDIDAPDVNGRTALYWAAWRGDILSLSLLLQYGADVDKIDSESWTPLARASKAGHLGVVQYLLSAHASLTISTAQGYLPIHLASDNKPDGAKIVQELLTRGSDPNACSISRGTPLHNAANRGSVATVECLLAHGAVIDALDGDGDTPVLISLLCWNEATFMCLARAGARLDIPRKIGHSVVHVAVWGANTGVWDWLIASAESGKTGDIDINALHDGHGIAACFDVCRTRWFPGKRELTLETVKFQRMIKIFGASPMV